MISAEFAETQIARLDATANFHLKSATAIAELVECLRVNSNDVHEAAEAIDLRLNHERDCPTVSDIRDALREVREGTGKSEPSTHSRSLAFQGGCTRCQGSGWYVVYQLCKQTLGGVLARDLSGWQEASAIRDKWKAERLAWNEANPGRIFKLRDSESIGQSARRCGCR